MKIINKKYLILFLIALSLRLLYIFVPAFDYYAKSFPASFYASEQLSDAHTYVELADGYNQLGYPAMKGRLVMFSGYVYPFILAMFMRMSQNLIPLFILQAVLSSLVCLMIARISSVLFRKELPGLISGYLWAFYYPAFVTISRSLTEAVFTFIFVGSVYFILTRKKEKAGAAVYFAAGAMISLAALTRAMVFYVFLFMVLAYLIYRFLNIRKIDYKVVFAIAGFILIQIPWTYLGYVHNGRIIIASTSGGGNLALGTYIPGNGEYDVEYFKSDPNHPINIIDKQYFEKNWTDAERDTAYMNLGRKQVIDNFRYHPLGALKLIGYQISRFWFNVPYLHKSGIGNTVNAVVTFILLLFMIYGYIKGRKENKTVSDLLMLLIVVFCLPHAFTVSVIRYSFPLLPIVYIYSGYGISLYLQKYNFKKGIIEKPIVRSFGEDQSPPSGGQNQINFRILQGEERSRPWMLR